MRQICVGVFSCHWEIKRTYLQTIARKLKRWI